MGRFFPPPRPIPIGNALDPRQYQGRPPLGIEVDRARNPGQILRSASVQSGAGGYTNTSQWVYTVPAGRVARWESCRASIRNNSGVSNAAGGVVVNVTVSTANGGTPATTVQVQLPIGAAAPAYVNEIVGQLGFLQAGSAVTAGFIDQNNTAGTNMTMDAHAVFTEFDT